MSTTLVKTYSLELCPNQETASWLGSGNTSQSGSKLYFKISWSRSGCTVGKQNLKKHETQIYW